MKSLLSIAIAVAVLAGAPSVAAQPATIHASYNLLRDGLHIATVDESFERSGGSYQLVSATNPAGALKRLFRTQIRIRSAGTVTAAGLQPASFEYGRLDDASRNVSAEFDWQSEQLRMTYQGGTRTVALPPATQDRLSVMYQFMFLPVSKLKMIPVSMTNGRRVESYRYDVAGRDTVDSPLGKFSALHLVRQREAGDNTVEVWLAPERSFFPVKLLIIENDGSRFEQVITRLEIK